MDFWSSAQTGIAPLTVAFTDTSQGESTAWTWDFGDGQSSAEQNPEHTYTAALVYPVTLSIEGPAGTGILQKVDFVRVYHASQAVFSASEVQGTMHLVEHLLQHTQGGGVINTAFIERLNATFRQRLAPLARRTRALAQGGDTLSTGMWILGCVYNFCDYHQSLRLRLSVGEHGYHWVQRTPAIAAGLTDHCWSLEELFAFPLPIPRWSPPVQRGRPSKETLQLIERWCH